MWSSRSRRYFSSQLKPSMTPQEVTGFAGAPAVVVPGPPLYAVASAKGSKPKTTIHKQAGERFVLPRTLFGKSPDAADIRRTREIVFKCDNG